MDKKELMEEMFTDWLWDKYYDELNTQAITEVEKEVGLWKSFFAKHTSQKIKDRRWELFEKLKLTLLTEKSRGKK